jgi:hypothetical protein
MGSEAVKVNTINIFQNVLKRNNTQNDIRGHTTRNSQNAFWSSTGDQKEEETEKHANGLPTP